MTYFKIITPLLNVEPDMLDSDLGLLVVVVVAVIFYVHILHLLRIILSLGCKVFISASPRMQWYCRIVMKNSVLGS